jgi:hypothetical protein
METMDLTKILKNVPKGTKLYSTVHGYITFCYISDEIDYPIKGIVDKNININFTKEGKNYKKYDGECILFPSKKNRDWSKFVIDLPKLTICFCFNDDDSSSKFIRLYNAKGEVFYDGYRSECSMSWEHIVPCDKYILETNYFDPKDDYGELSDKKW